MLGEYIGTLRPKIPHKQKTIGVIIPKVMKGWRGTTIDSFTRMVHFLKDMLG